VKRLFLVDLSFLSSLLERSRFHFMVQPTSTGIISYPPLAKETTQGELPTVSRYHQHSTSAQFLAWNPAVSSDSSDNCWVGYASCVGLSGASSCPSSTSTKPSATTSSGSSPDTTSAPAATTAGPSLAGQTFPGSPCQCNEWYVVVAGHTCATLETMFNITADQFFEWNPEVSTNCTLTFYVGFSYCVGVSGATACPTTTSASSTPVPVNTMPYSYISSGTFESWGTRPTATEFPPKPTQSGIPSNCKCAPQSVVTTGHLHPLISFSTCRPDVLSGVCL
jgi:hypothetical protein